MIRDLFSTENARQVGNGLLSPAGSLRDSLSSGSNQHSELMKRIAGYKRAVAGRYSAVAPAEIENLPLGSLLVSPKIDGQFWVLVAEAGEVVLVAPNGKVLSGDLPLLAEAKRTLSGRAQGLTLCAGELFALRKEGRPRVSDVSTALSGGATAEVARLGFFAFDLLDGGDAASPQPAAEYAERLKTLERLFEGGQRVKAIKTEFVHSQEEVRRLFGEWAEGGKGEGLVVRSFDGRIFKLKPIFSLDAAIIGFTEQTDARDHVRSLLLALMRENGQFQLIGSCGNLGSDTFRAELYRKLAPAVVDSKYRFASSTGALFRFVAPREVVEVTVTDLQTEDGESRPIRRMVLDFDAAQGWIPLQLKAGISLIHPILTRHRDDKEVNPVDVRASQILERCEIEELEVNVPRIERERSELLRREVYTKNLKGNLAVRKLLVWKTNKEKQDPTFPAYVVHFTDYSPGRQEPLQKEVRLAPSAEEAESLATEMLAENIKKGWERVV